MNLKERFPQIYNRLKLFLKDKAVCGILFSLLVVNIAIKIMYCLNLDLNSDLVSPGMVSIEIYENKNYFLSGYYFPAADPYLFTDILPFHMIPQILSGYDPSVLKITQFAIVLLLTIIIAYNVYKKYDILAGILFLCLFYSMPNTSYYFYAQPVCHSATILFICILGVLYYKYINNASYILLGCSAVLTLAGVYSDKLLIVWFAIPIALTSMVLYFTQEPDKKRFSAIYSVVVCFSAVIACIINKTVVENVQTSYHIINDLEILRNNVSLFINGIVNVYNANIYHYIHNMSFDISTTITIIITLALLVVAVRYAIRNMRTCFITFTLFAFISTIGLYVLTDVAVDIGTSRYLTFPVLLLLIMIVAAVKESDTQYLQILLIVLVLISTSQNILMPNLGTNNEEEKDLISYLDANNLTFGYADYWESNIITYLAGQNVSVRAVTFTDNSLVPYRWLACEDWYRPSNKTSFFLLSREKNLQNRELLEYLANNPPDKALNYKVWDIYIYNKSPRNTLEDYY